MDTKLKADIAESAVVTELLKRGFSVLRPLGDRLPYDLGVDLREKLICILGNVGKLQRAMGFVVQRVPQPVTVDGKTCQIRWNPRYRIRAIPSQARLRREGVETSWQGS